MLDHVSDGVWQCDENNHWNACSVCGQAMNLVAHEKSKWIVDLDATAGVEGKKHIECLTCKMVLEHGTIEPTSSITTEEILLSLKKNIDFVLDYMTEYMDAFLNYIFSSDDIHFFRENKYVTGAVSGGFVLLIIMWIAGAKRRRRRRRRRGY